MGKWRPRDSAGGGRTGAKDHGNPAKCLPSPCLHGYNEATGRRGGREIDFPINCIEEVNAMRIVLMICCILMLALPARALEIAGVTIPETIAGDDGSSSSESPHAAIPDRTVPIPTASAMSSTWSTGMPRAIRMKILPKHFRYGCTLAHNGRSATVAGPP